jgi:hypothetical protein
MLLDMVSAVCNSAWAVMGDLFSELMHVPKLVSDGLDVLARWSWKTFVPPESSGLILVLLVAAASVVSSDYSVLTACATTLRLLLRGFGGLHRFCRAIKKEAIPASSPPIYSDSPRPPSRRRIALHVSRTGAMNVTTAKYLAAKEKPSMSNITPDAERTPAAAAQPSQPETKPKKAKGAKPAKKAKDTKPAKAPKKKAKPAKKAAGKPAAERSNKKAEVIVMMKRAKGATLAEIAEATGWQRHTIRGFVSILGSKGGETIESSKNAAGERTYKIAK